VVLVVAVDMVLDCLLDLLLYLQMEYHQPLKVMMVEQELLVIQASQVVVAVVVLADLVLHLHIPVILEEMVVWVLRHF
tara:strand:+ start:270 stop:503 length:234 start_codon:yes stop_codon:yes gene_type:complete